MSQLYFSYNMNLLKRFKHLADLFSDVPELRTEVNRLIGIVRKDKHTTEVYEEIKRDTQDHVDAIFAAQPDPATLDRIPIFARMRLRTIFETRLHESERETFWSTIRSAIKHGSVLSAVGSKASQMETLARDFVEQNPDLSPEQYQQAIFQQMLTGGPLAQNLLSCFKDPENFKNILQSFDTMLRQPGQESLGLASLINTIKPSELQNIDQEFANLQREIKETGVNPFEKVTEQLKRAPVPQSSDEDNPFDYSLASTVGVTDAMRALIQKAKEEGSKEKKE